MTDTSVLSAEAVEHPAADGAAPAGTPDAVIVPVDLVKGGDLLERVRHITSLCADALKCKRVTIHNQGTYFFCYDEARPIQSLLFPFRHPKHPAARYEWHEQEAGGLSFGYHVADAADALGTGARG